MYDKKIIYTNLKLGYLLLSCWLLIIEEVKRGVQEEEEQQQGITNMLALPIDKLLLYRNWDLKTFILQICFVSTSVSTRNLEIST